VAQNDALKQTLKLCLPTRAQIKFEKIVKISAIFGAV
jgi:hypothetical protein